MEDEQWRQFFRTGSIRDYLSCKTCVNGKRKSPVNTDGEGDSSDESDYSDGHGADISTDR